MNASKRCPIDFLITEEMRIWAEAKVPGVDIDEETEMLCDHEFRNSHQDWPATWRNWMRREQKQINRHQSNRDFYAGKLQKPVTQEQTRREIYDLAIINGVARRGDSWHEFQGRVKQANDRRIEALN